MAFLSAMAFEVAVACVRAVSSQNSRNTKFEVAVAVVPDHAGHLRG